MEIISDHCHSTPPPWLDVQRTHYRGRPSEVLHRSPLFNPVPRYTSYVHLKYHILDPYGHHVVPSDGELVKIAAGTRVWAVDALPFREWR